jgi:hypothetical protein
VSATKNRTAITYWHQGFGVRADETGAFVPWIEQHSAEAHQIAISLRLGRTAEVECKDGLWIVREPVTPGRREALARKPAGWSSS